MIWLVTYDGQWDGREGLSPYTWMTFSHHGAVQLKGELEAEYPDRVWKISEKDVS